jgi:hypothetical protein
MSNAIRISPHSKPGKLALLDGRRAEARFLAQEEAELKAACGGEPTALQLKLIARAALLALRLHLMDKQSIDDPILSERNSKFYLAWVGAYNRALAQIAALNPKNGNGHKPAPPSPLNDYLATHPDTAIRAPRRTLPSANGHINSNGNGDAT